MPDIDFAEDVQSITIEDLVPQLRAIDYQFTAVPKDILYMNNGIKYYYVEIRYNDKNFLINAHGNEAERLFTAVNPFTEY